MKTNEKQLTDAELVKHHHELIGETVRRLVETPFGQAECERLLGTKVTQVSMSPEDETFLLRRAGINTKRVGRLERATLWNSILWALKLLLDHGKRAVSQ